MKILVTGADGQLGMSLGKISGDYPQHGFVFTDLPAADITDRDAIRRLIGESSAELVVNCAAYTAVDRAEGDPDAADRVNRAGAGNLAVVAREYGIPLIHISTDYVFDGAGSRPLTEDDRPNPQSVYGRTKLAGEEAVRDAGCAAAVVRTSWLYSEFGSNFVRTMLRLGVGGHPLRVVNDQRGCPTYATDLARAIVQIAENGVEGFGIYNYCNAGETTWYGFAREIFGRAGMDVEVLPVTTAEYSTAARRPAYSVLDTAKVRQAGVVVPDWRSSLAECLAALGYGK